MGQHDDTGETASPHGAHGHLAGHDHVCDEVLRELYTFVDGELTVERRARIEAHLDDCLPCFEAYDFEAELRIVISQRCRDSVPSALRDRIAQALDAEPSDVPPPI
jgi:mycothiol system anti-sigma-R factor